MATAGRADPGRAVLTTALGADGGARPSLYRLTTCETLMTPPATATTGEGCSQR